MTDLAGFGNFGAEVDRIDEAILIDELRRLRQEKKNHKPYKAINDTKAVDSLAMYKAERDTRNGKH